MHLGLKQQRKVTYGPSRGFADFCHSSGNAACGFILFFFKCVAEKQPILKALSCKPSCVNISVHFSLLICYSSPTPSPLCDSRLFTFPSERELCSLKFPGIKLRGGPSLSFAAACRALAVPSIRIQTKWPLVFPCWMTRRSRTATRTWRASSAPDCPDLWLYHSPPR